MGWLLHTVAGCIFFKRSLSFPFYFGTNGLADLKSIEQLLFSHNILICLRLGSYTYPRLVLLLVYTRKYIQSRFYAQCRIRFSISGREILTLHCISH